MPVYFDSNATTPVDPRVLEAMLPYFGGRYGNPSSAHGFGKAARHAIDQAREQVAALVNARPSEVLFTSGGTEANNWVLRSVTQTAAPGTVAVSAIEHPAVLTAAEALMHDVAAGWRVESIPVTAQGRVAVQQALASDTRLLSVMWANNETGAVQPITELAQQAQTVGAWMHTDAVQAVGKVPVDFAAAGVQFMTLAAHKLYGPKGIGALVVDRRIPIQPMLFGGGHEQGLRPGTENLPAIVGFGQAAALAQQELQTRAQQAKQLQEQLLAGLAELTLPVFTPEHEPRLPNTVQFAVPGMEGETLLMLLDAQGFAVSSGSACATGKHEPSHVLAAMGVEAALAIGAIRVSFSMNPAIDTANTADDVTRFLAVLANWTPRS